jgi:hypothetical protein
MFSLHVRKQKRTNIYQVITHTKTKQVTGSKYYLNYLYYNRSVTGTTFIWANLSRKIGPARLDYEFVQAYPTWSYHYNGELHRVDGPSTSHNPSTLLDQTWNKHGKTHRFNGWLLISPIIILKNVL